MEFVTHTFAVYALCIAPRSDTYRKNYWRVVMRSVYEAADGCSVRSLVTSRLVTYFFVVIRVRKEIFRVRH